MKKMIFILLFVFVFSNIQAQTKKDSIFVNKKAANTVSLLTTGFLTNDYIFEYVGLRYGKSITGNFLSGIELGRTFYGYWERTTNFGVFGRYYFANFEYFRYYSEAKYLFGLRYYENENTGQNWNGITNDFALNIGITFDRIFKKRLGLEFFTGYAFNSFSTKNHPATGPYKSFKHNLDYGFQMNFYF